MPVGSFGEASQRNAQRWASLASASRNKNTLSLAQSLLGVKPVSYGGGGKVATAVNEENNTESPFGRLLDLLTTPLAGVAGAASGIGTVAREAAAGDFDFGDLAEIPKQAAQGVGANLYSVGTGDPNIENKKSFMQVFRDLHDADAAKSVGLKENQLEQYRQEYEPDDMPNYLKAAAFGGDVAGDPLTYLTGGASILAKLGIKGGKAVAEGAEQAGKLVDDIPLGQAGNARPHPGSNRLALTSTPESILDNGQMVLPGTHVPKVTPEPQRGEFGAEIAQGDYELPGQLNFAGMTGRQTRPKTSQQQGTLFDSEPFRGETVGKVERGYEATGELPRNVQGDANSAGLLFTKGGEPYPAFRAPDPGSVVKGIPAPVAPKPIQLAADLTEALKPGLIEKGVNPEALAKLSQAIDPEKAAALDAIPMFTATGKTIAHASDNAKAATNAAVAKVLTEDLGVSLTSPSVLDDFVPVDFGTGLNPKVQNINIGSIGKALATGNIGSLKGARFLIDDAKGGHYVPIEKLVSKVQGAVQKGAVTPGAAGGAGMTASVVNQAWRKAAEEAGFTEKEIQRILGSPDAKKTIKKLVAASKAKADSVAKTSPTESGVSSVIEAPPALTPGPIPQQLDEAVAVIESQKVAGHAAISSIAGEHPEIVETLTKNWTDRAAKITADKRTKPSPEIAKKMREGNGVVHSVPNPKGVSGNNPHHQMQNLFELSALSGKIKPYLRTLKKGQKVSPEQQLIRADFILKGMRASEEALTSLGHPPVAFFGSNLAFRLSDFLASVAVDVGTTTEQLIIRLGWLRPYGPAATDKTLSEIITKAITTGNNQGFDLLPASEFPAVAEYLKSGKVIQAAKNTKAVNETIPEIAELLSLSDSVKGAAILRSDAEELKLATHDIPELAAAKVAEKGGDQAAADIVSDTYADDILGVPDNPMPKTVDAGATTATAKAAKNDPTVDHIRASLDEADKMDGVTGTMEKIANTEKRWANLFCPWYGFKDLYHLQAQKVQGATAIANLYIRVYAQTIKEMELTTDDMLGAWRAIRGEEAAIGAKGEKAVEFINMRMSNILEAADTANAYKVGTSVVNRSGLTPNEINKQLDVTGLDFRFDPTNKEWKNSWREYKGDVDPMTFAAKMETAVTRATTRKGAFADLAYNFHVPGGVKVDPNVFPELANSTFDPLIAKQIPLMVGRLDQIMSPSGEFGKAIDSFLASWKTIVTIPMPSHHIRNLIGDMFFAYLAGVPIGNPALIAKMGKVMAAQRQFYKDIAPSESTTQILLEMLQGNAAEKSILSATPTTAISRITGRGHTIDINAYDMWSAAFERGVIKHSALIEDIPTKSISEQLLEKTTNPLVHKIVAPTGGKFMKGARQVSETREHGVRMLHFIHASEQAVKKNLARGFAPERALRLGFDEAAAKVTKWHPDGTGLTEFEAKTMRRLFPFYSWTRKAIPLLAESLINNPAKLTLYPKFMHDVVGADNQQDLANPWPLDQIFPRWLREMPIGPVGNLVDGYTVFNPSNPFTDLGNQFINDPKQGIMGMLNPLARVPAEVATGTDAQTGAPIKDWGAYADKQIPQLAVANRLGNTDLGFGSIGSVLGGGSPVPLNKTGKAQGQYLNGFGVWNSLTAAGLIDASQPNYVKQGQYEIKDKKAAEARKRREEYLREQGG